MFDDREELMEFLLLDTQPFELERLIVTDEEDDEDEDDISLPFIESHT